MQLDDALLAHLTWTQPSSGRCVAEKLLLAARANWKGHLAAGLIKFLPSDLAKIRAAIDGCAPEDKDALRPTPAEWEAHFARFLAAVTPLVEVQVGGPQGSSDEEGSDEEGSGEEDSDEEGCVEEDSDEGGSHEEGSVGEFDAIWADLDNDANPFFDPRELPGYCALSQLRSDW